MLYYSIVTCCIRDEYNDHHYSKKVSFMKKEIRILLIFPFFKDSCKCIMAIRCTGEVMIIYIYAIPQACYLLLTTPCIKNGRVLMEELCNSLKRSRSNIFSSERLLLGRLKPLTRHREERFRSCILLINKWTTAVVRKERTLHSFSQKEQSTDCTGTNLALCDFYKYSTRSWQETYIKIARICLNMYNGFKLNLISPKPTLTKT